MITTDPGITAPSLLSALVKLQESQIEQEKKNHQAEDHRHEDPKKNNKKQQKMLEMVLSQRAQPFNENIEESLEGLEYFPEEESSEFTPQGMNLLTSDAESSETSLKGTHLLTPEEGEESSETHPQGQGQTASHLGAKPSKTLPQGQTPAHSGSEPEAHPQGQQTASSLGAHPSEVHPQGQTTSYLGAKPSATSSEAEATAFVLGAEAEITEPIPVDKPFTIDDLIKILSLIMKICMSVQDSQCQLAFKMARDQYQEQIKSAKSEYDAGMTQAITGMVCGAFSMAVSVGAGMFGAKGLKNNNLQGAALSANGSAKLPNLGTNKAGTDQWVQLLMAGGKSVSELGSGVGNMVASGQKYEAAEHHANAEYLATMQRVQEKFIDGIVNLNEKEMDALRSAIDRWLQVNGWTSR